MKEERLFSVQRCGAVVRVGRELDSARVCDLSGGTQVTAVESACDGGRERLKIEAPVVGWLSRKTLHPITAKISKGGSDEIAKSAESTKDAESAKSAESTKDTEGAKTAESATDAESVLSSTTRWASCSTVRTSVITIATTCAWLSEAVMMMRLRPGRSQLGSMSGRSSWRSLRSCPSHACGC